MLAARIARARDQWLRPADRLRHATTLPVPRAPAPRPPGAPDLAAARAARLPDQLWPDWAVRLTDDPASSSHVKFLPAALIALLLPHSDMPLNQVTAMVGGQLRRHIAGYHMSKLTTEALRILTELAFAIDDHGIPVDYRRRRDLAAGATLIDDDAWTTCSLPRGTPASAKPHKRWAYGPALFTTSSAGPSAPAVARWSTAAPALQASGSSHRSASSYASKPATTCNRPQPTPARRRPAADSESWPTLPNVAQQVAGFVALPTAVRYRRRMAAIRNRVRTRS